MNIVWYGETSFRLKTKTQETATLLFDPCAPRQEGLRGPNFSSDLVALTREQNLAEVRKKIDNQSFLIHEPGEYERKNIFVEGIAFPPEEPADKQSIIYRVLIEGMQIVHLGAINQLLSNQQLEKLDGVDILIVPVGGHAVFSAEEAVKTINQIEPKIVIPCCFKIKGMKGKLNSEKDFLEEIGSEPVMTDQLNISRSNLSEEETDIVVLQPKA